MTTRDDKKVALPEPEITVAIDAEGIPRRLHGGFYATDQLESYAAARVAEATAEIEASVRALLCSAVPSACPHKTCYCQYVRTVISERDELQRRVAELEALVGDLFAQYTRPYGAPVDRPPFITHNPTWKALAERAGIIADREGGKA